MTEKRQKPALLAFTSSNAISTRLLNYCKEKGYQLFLISNVGELDSLSQKEIPGKKARIFGEPLEGVEGHLLEILTRLRPVLLIFDIDNWNIPWRKWLPVVKSNPATRRVPVISFSDILDLELVRDLEERGTDVSLSAQQFLDDLYDWIQQTAFFMDYESINAACSEPLSVLAVEGLNYFNQGDYFEAHEKLEDAWNEEQSIGREMYRAILQVAVAYLQIERGNYNGAVKMFLRLRQWIDPLPERCRGVNIEHLRTTAREVYDHLIVSGPDKVSEFDLTLFKPIEF
jgi:predicted metal-dependent hydrolase